jgi:hypothetical protein
MQIVELSSLERSYLLNPATDSGSVAVGITPVKVMDYNSNRHLAIITNDSALDIYLGFGRDVTINSGIRLNALGGSFSFGLATDFPYLGQIYAVAAGAANNLTYVEV